MRYSMLSEACSRHCRKISHQRHSDDGYSNQKKRTRKLRIIFYVIKQKYPLVYHFETNLTSNAVQIILNTRMVQLPATAAIEYVVASCRTRTKTRTKIRTKTKTKTKTVRGAYARFPQVQCVYAPSRLSVPSIVAWRTKKKTNKKPQTRPPSSVGSRPPLPKFSGYVEVEAHYTFHLSTIWVWPLFMELGPKKHQKSQFCHKANEYM